MHCQTYVYVYLEVRPSEFSEVYFQVSAQWTAA